MKVRLCLACNDRRHAECSNPPECDRGKVVTCCCNAAELVNLWEGGVPGIIDPNFDWSVITRA